jgi:hypothetical protein
MSIATWILWGIALDVSIVIVGWSLVDVIR